MRNRILYISIALFLLSGFSFGQGAPVPALSSPLGDNVSFSYMLMVKNRSNPVFGNGAEFNSTHYFTRHLAVSAEVEALQMSRWSLHESAVRVGPTYRLNVGSNFQPFVRVLAGYAAISATNYFGPNRPRKFGGSLLVGAGTDVRVKGPLFTRFTADVVDDWDIGTNFARGTVGFAYHFGDRGPR